MSKDCHPEHMQLSADRGLIHMTLLQGPELHTSPQGNVNQAHDMQSMVQCLRGYKTCNQHTPVDAIEGGAVLVQPVQVPGCFLQQLLFYARPRRQYAI